MGIKERKIKHCIGEFLLKTPSFKDREFKEETSMWIYVIFSVFIGEESVAQRG